MGRPFNYLLPVDWVSCWGAYDAMRASYPVPYTDFFKLRGAERDCVSPLWFYSAFNCWPFAPCVQQSVASWLREQLEAEPELLAHSYEQLRLVNIGFFLLQWAGPLIFLLILIILLTWTCFYFLHPGCRQCTNRCARNGRDGSQRCWIRSQEQCKRCLYGSASSEGEKQKLTSHVDDEQIKASGKGCLGTVCC